MSNINVNTSENAEIKIEFVIFVGSEFEIQMFQGVKKTRINLPIASLKPCCKAVPLE